MLLARLVKRRSMQLSTGFVPLPIFRTFFNDKNINIVNNKSKLHIYIYNYQNKIKSVKRDVYIRIKYKSYIIKLKQQNNYL